MSQRSTIDLNNYLQGLKKDHLLSVVEQRSGGEWNVTYKYEGVVVGEARAAQKELAKEAASEAALAAIKEKLA